MPCSNCWKQRPTLTNQMHFVVFVYIDVNGMAENADPTSINRVIPDDRILGWSKYSLVALTWALLRQSLSWARAETLCIYMVPYYMQPQPVEMYSKGITCGDFSVLKNGCKTSLLNMSKHHTTRSAVEFCIKLVLGNIRIIWNRQVMINFMFIM